MEHLRKTGKKKLSAAQIEAIEWIGEEDINRSFFYPFNCYLKKQTVDALFRMGIIVKVKGASHYAKLSKIGKTYFTQKSKSKP